MGKEPKSQLSGHYDQVYSEDKKAFGQGIPEDFVIKAAELIPKNGDVIEFGAGQDKRIENHRERLSSIDFIGNQARIGDQEIINSFKNKWR
ncbi:MAG: hypothetical protein AAB641_02345 [Patescibacteria group bacterium]